MRFLKFYFRLAFYKLTWLKHHVFIMNYKDDTLDKPIKFIAARKRSQGQKNMFFVKLAEL